MRQHYYKLTTLRNVPTQPKLKDIRLTIEVMQCGQQTFIEQLMCAKHRIK